MDLNHVTSTARSTQNENGVAVFGADGVARENLTARQYQQNGFNWRSVWGYRENSVFVLYGYALPPLFVIAALLALLRVKGVRWLRSGACSSGYPPPIC